MKAILADNVKANVVVVRLAKSLYSVFWSEMVKLTLLPYPNTQTATLLLIIRKQVKPDSIVYTDCYHSYDVLDVSEFSHLRINHSTHFAERQNHINGIENFWNQAKRHLRQFNGISKEHFELYLKECEWRFNNSEMKVQIFILKQLVKKDLF